MTKVSSSVFMHIMSVNEPGGNVLTATGMLHGPVPTAVLARTWNVYSVSAIKLCITR